MKLITPEYLALQKDLFAKTGDYGRAGDRWLRQVLDLAEQTGAKSILDYGCGRGSLVYSLQAADIDARGYDPAMDTYSQNPVPADLVVCVDVMEHIEPMLLVNVILHLRQLTIKRLLVAISLRAAGKRLRDGRNAHLIIESASWWAEQMRRGFKIHRVRPSNPDEWVAELIPKET